MPFTWVPFCKWQNFFYAEYTLLYICTLFYLFIDHIMDTLVDSKFWLMGTFVNRENVTFSILMACIAFFFSNCSCWNCSAIVNKSDNAEHPWLYCVWEETLAVFPSGVTLGVGWWYTGLTVLRDVHSVLHYAGEGMSNLITCFFASIKMTIWFLFFTLMMWFMLIGLFTFYTIYILRLKLDCDIWLLM